MIEVEFVTKNGVVGTSSVPQLPPPGYVIETGKGRPMLVIGGVLREGERPRVLVEHVLVDKEYSAVHVAAPPHLAEASERARLLSLEQQTISEGILEWVESRDQE